MKPKKSMNLKEKNLQILIKFLKTNLLQKCDFENIVYVTNNVIRKF